MLERLVQLEENTALLGDFRSKHSLAEVAQDKQLQWALRYGILESIQIVIDTACHLCAKYNLGTPKNYADCIRFLVQFEYLPESLLPGLTATIGLRNLIIHEYVRIEPARLYAYLDEIEIFRDYARSVKKYM